MTEITSYKDYQEIDFACLAGPTHNYGALSYGNKASEGNRGQASNPLAAVTQSIEKISKLYDLGTLQAVLPPHERQNLATLRRLGFTGTDEQVIDKAHKEDPTLLTRVSSSAAMWSANAATVAPSCDTMDGKLHMTPASLQANFHRAIEAEFAHRTLSYVFRQLVDNEEAVIHEPLPNYPGLGDEGAANHMRFAQEHGHAGTHLFVYGKNDQLTQCPAPAKYPARQQKSASEALARLHQLPKERVVLAQQNPNSIDGGIFHNDVTSVNNLGIWMMAQGAYLNEQKIVDDIRSSQRGDLYVATSTDLDLETIVNTYVFNSQILSLPDGTMMIAAAKQSKDNPKTMAFLESIINDPSNPITKVEFFDLDQSMKNGGGPACLRLRVVLSEEERGKLNGRVFFDSQLKTELKQ